MFLPVDHWNWEEILAFLSAISVIAGALYGVVRLLLAGNFVTHQDHEDMETRVAKLEQHSARLATKEDLEGLEVRITPVETGVAVLGAEVKAVREGVQRTEHMVSMLIEHQLRKEPA